MTITSIIGLKILFFNNRIIGLINFFVIAKYLVSSGTIAIKKKLYQQKL